MSMALYIIITLSAFIGGMMLGSIFTVVYILREARKAEQRALKSLTSLYPTNPQDTEKWKEGQDKLDPRDEGWLRRMLDDITKKKKDNDKDKK